MILGNFLCLMPMGQPFLLLRNRLLKPVSLDRISVSSLFVLRRCKMAAEQQHPNNSSLEIKEPSPKIQKLHHQNGIVANHVSVDSLSLLRVKKLSDKAVLPSRASPLSAGYDLSSAIDTKVPARGKALVATDLSIAIPEGTYARIAPRSGLAWKHSIDVGAGVVDADYRGPVGVILFNHSDVDFVAKTGDRIAQLILEKIMTPDVVEVEELDSTVRGAGGFGSTGVSAQWVRRLFEYLVADLYGNRNGHQRGRSFDIWSMGEEVICRCSGKVMVVATAFQKFIALVVRKRNTFDLRFIPVK